MCNSGKKINILIHDIGSVTHGIIRKIKDSKLLGNIYVISGVEPYDEECIHLGKASNIKIGELKKIIKEKDIDFAVIFSERAYACGLADYYLQKIKLPTIGVTQEWFKLEASKIQGKSFMDDNNILTPEYKIIRRLEDIESAISSFGLPIVIKNNYLEAGFGSHVCLDEKTALKFVKRLIKKDKFCIAEKFVQGFEISQQYFWDKNTLLPVLAVKDFKRPNNEISSINTGGLACYTPVALTEDEKKLLEEYNLKLQGILKKEEPDFTGIITANLLYANKELYTLEFNMRPGIAEFETLIEHLDCDLLQILYNCAYSKLEGTDIKYKEGITGCITVAHKDYLKQKIKKMNISLSKYISPYDNNIKLNFNAIFDIKNKKLKITTNKRFLSVLCTDKADPFKKIYKFLSNIKTKDLYYRKDIEYEK